MDNCGTAGSLDNVIFVFPYNDENMLRNLWKTMENYGTDGS